MKKDAEAHESEDAKFKELVELRNQADQLINATETTIKENEDKLSQNLIIPQKTLELIKSAAGF